MNKSFHLYDHPSLLTIFPLEYGIAHITMKVSARLATAFLLAVTAAPVMASSVQWNGRLSAVKCNQIGKGMEFTLDIGQRVLNSEVDVLCSCIATNTNKRGWELPTIQKISEGQEVGFIKRNGALSRFGKAVETCSKGKYYR